MPEDKNILSLDDKARLSADITFLMLKGGGYALVAVLLIWLVIAVLAGIGRALPEDSRNTPDPTPLSSLEIALPASTEVV